MTAPAAAPVTPERILQFAWGYAPALLLEAAIRHRVFDVLDSGPLSLAELQACTGASQRGLAAIVNALVGLNFLSKDGDGTFSLTPESAAFLVSTKPAFQGGLIRHCSEHLIPRWLNLNEIVATGVPPKPAGNARKHRKVRVCGSVQFCGGRHWRGRVRQRLPDCYARAHSAQRGRTRSKALLAKVFASLAPGGTISIAEFSGEFG